MLAPKLYITDKVNWKQLTPKVKISSVVHDKDNTFVGYTAPILYSGDEQIILDNFRYNLYTTGIQLSLANKFCLSLPLSHECRYPEVWGLYEDDHEWGA